MGDIMHIVYCGDAAYVPMIGISMTSVVWNNLDSRIVFHLLVDDLRQRDAVRLQAFGRLYRNVAGIRVHRIDGGRPEMKVFRQLDSSYPESVNYRLLLPELLEDTVERVLYLDGDVICRGSIRTLWETNMGEALVAGVRDPLEQMHFQRVGGKVYVNTGVLLMDLAGWRRANILEKVLDFYRQSGYLGYPDQDAINVTCRGYVLDLPSHWNYPVSCNFTVKGRRNDIAPEARLCHFLGPVTKPWNVTCLDPRAKLWTCYRERSFWAGRPQNGSDNPELVAEMRSIRRQLEDGDGRQAFRRYRRLIKALGCRFEPILLQSAAR